MANEEDDAFRNLRNGRLLALSVTHVEVRLYRSSRTSCDSIRSPAHFKFFVKCTWSGDACPSPHTTPRPLCPSIPWTSPRATSPLHGPKRAPWASPRATSRPQTSLPAVSSTLASAQVENHGDYWWDPLPSTYVVTRRWADIERLHATIEKNLVFDRKAGCRRIKARMPQLPAKADLDEFILGVAASGDAKALSRRSDQILTPNGDLVDAHTIYVQNRLNPYFAQISRVLDEVPDDVLVACAPFKLFVTDGTSTKHRPPHPAMQPKFFGPQSLALSYEDKSALAYRFRRMYEKEVAARKNALGGGKMLKSASSPSV